MKKLLKWTKLFLILQVIFFVFALASSLLPSSGIIHNIRKSADEYHSQDVYDEPFLSSAAHRSDNFTDFIILNLNYHIDEVKPLKYVIMPQGKLHYGSTARAADDHLRYAMNYRKNENNFFYGRYWHGSTFFYRWFLLAGSLSKLRVINFVLTSLILFAFCKDLGKSLSKPEFYSMFIGLILINFYLFFMSMQFAPIFMVTMIGSIVLLRKIKNGKSVAPLFLILGALTCYFDLLTVPIISLGIPMLVWACVKLKEVDLVQNLKEVFLYSAIWGVGYVGTWCFKWLLVFLFTNHAIFDDVSMKLSERAGVWVGSRFDVIEMNINLIDLPVFYIISTFLLLLLAFFFTSKNWKKSIIFLVIALMPLAWYIVTSNHAQMHNWFTYRALWVSISGVFLALSNLIDWQRVDNIFRKKKLI